MSEIDEVSLPRRIALAHEWFSPRSVGGAEKVVRAIDEVLLKNGSNVNFVALVDGESSQIGSWMHGRNVQTSFIQNLPWGVSHVQNYLPLLPYAIEQIDVTSYPLVVSSSHLVAKGVLTSPEQLHVSYVHTPVRYAWDQMHIYLQRSALRSIGLGPFIRFQLHQLRQWDQLSGARIDCIFANSRFTASRIASYWRRDAEVIHPPVSVDQFRWDMPRADFYLCLSRLVPNKRVDLVVKAFNQLGLPLLVIGDGPERVFLEKLAGPTVKLLGYQTLEEVQYLMGTCRAFVYAGLEDFGIAPVEAMAAGAPVIALGKGGLLDTVRSISMVDGTATGLLFQEQTVASVKNAVTWFEEKQLWRQFSSEYLRRWAENFRPEAFAQRFEIALKKAWQHHKKSCAVAASDPGSLPYLRL